MSDIKQTKDVSDTLALSTKTESTTPSLNVLNLFDDKQLAAAEVFLKKIISTDKGGIKSVNEGLAILMRTQDLGLPFSSSIEHIHVINGKTGVDIHIIKSLLSRAGITWKCTKDYVPQYQYTDGNNIYNETQLPEYCVKCRTPKEAEEKTNDDTVGVYPLRFYADLKGNIYNEFQISDKCKVALNKVQAIKLAQDGSFPVLRIPAQPVDYVTNYHFCRYRNINGKEVLMEADGHFSLSEATQANLITKDVWQNYTRIMVSNRAFTLGAREIADDLIMGCRETTELKIIEGKDLTENDFIDAVEV